MSRKFVDCRDLGTGLHCTIAISADNESELLEATVQHMIALHGHQDTPELRKQIRASVRQLNPPLETPYL